LEVAQCTKDEVPAGGAWAGFTGNFSGGRSLPFLLLATALVVVVVLVVAVLLVVMMSLSLLLTAAVIWLAGLAAAS
jgi:hypothetical protein